MLGSAKYSAWHATGKPVSEHLGCVPSSYFWIIGFVLKKFAEGNVPQHTFGLNAKQSVTVKRSTLAYYVHHLLATVPMT